MSFWFPIEFTKQRVPSLKTVTAYTQPRWESTSPKNDSIYETSRWRDLCRLFAPLLFDMGPFPYGNISPPARHSALGAGHVAFAGGVPATAAGASHRFRARGPVVDKLVVALAVENGRFLV